ncbi:MAG TPA: M20/M25/M40 family metallo-hydrolase [Bryobacteraceae bacterium]|nr:M20/M25/M40 family metallo-hydrolase [Bryobacteraceae bacterium]
MALRLCVLAFAALLLSAQPGTRTRLATGFDSIHASHMRANLTFLSSDALEGRLSLTRGSEVAIQWIASEFAKARLKPISNGTFLQPVPLIEYRTDRQASSLTVEHAGAKKILHAPDASTNFPSDLTIAGPVLFAGFGITAPELNYDDYKGIDARGAVVLVFDHEPQENDPKSIFNGTGNTRYATSRVKLLNAQKHGAVALLVVAEPNRKHPSNQQRAARVTGGQQTGPRFASEAIEGDELGIPLFTVSEQVAADLLGAAGKRPGDLQASIDRDLHPVSLAIPETQVELHIVTRERRRATSANVIGLLEGSDPSLKAETIVISAHYDHNGPAANGGVYHGADDNGSGTVGVIELARAFARNEIKPRRSILFAVFAAEERGLLGSYYYVQHPLRPLATTRAVINFDMIGRNETPSEQTKGLIEIAADTSNELNLVGAKYSPDYRGVVEQANRSVGLKLNYKWDDEAALNVFFRSDQFPFVLRDIPAMWWFTGFHPDYHQVTDTVEKINFVKMEKIVRLAYLAGWSFADGPTPPKFVPNPAGQK